MELIITTKKEKAAAHLMKESIFQIKDYIEENMDDPKLKERNADFSLILFMANISMEWMRDVVEKINLALSDGRVWIEAETAVKITSLINFYYESSGDIFFASNLFDIAKDLLIVEECAESDDAICVRNID